MIYVDQGAEGLVLLGGINLIYHSIGSGGGMERYVIDVIKSIAGRGLPLRVICRKLNWNESIPHGVDFVVMRDQLPFSRMSNALFEANALKRCRPDWPTIGISKVKGVDMAISGGTHIGHLQRKGRKTAGLFDRLKIRNERAMYRDAEIIVAHSAQTEREIVAFYGVSDRKTVTLYPPVDTDTFSLQARARRAEIRKGFGASPDAMVLLFPSNDHVRKGGDLILGALDRFEGRIQLVVAGKAPLRGRHVINLGYRDDMAEVYAAADATILASKYEPFGLIGPESILCGTPVLLANTVGASEVLSDHACFRFERTVEGLSRCLGDALIRFKAGLMPISDPTEHLLYPHSVKTHVDALLHRLVQIERIHTHSHLPT